MSVFVNLLAVAIMVLIIIMIIMIMRYSKNTGDLVDKIREDLPIYNNAITKVNDDYPLYSEAINDTYPQIKNMVNNVCRDGGVIIQLKKGQILKTKLVGQSIDIPGEDSSIKIPLAC
jgi:predicted PurR-regulated permease PerM